MVSCILRNLYSNVFSQCYSPEAALLAVGNSEGKIILFDLKTINDNRDVGRIGDRLRGPCSTIDAHTDAVFSMTSTPDFCISGTTGLISGRKWTHLLDENMEASWNISLACDQANFGTPEVNGLAFDQDRNVVYAACGDWRTHVYDLETGKQTSTFDGHEDYVHDVVYGSNMVASSGEDGQVLIWDPRAGKEPRHKLRPHDQPVLTRPALGKFVSSLDVASDWLVCGGGPKAGVFHLRSMALATILPPDDFIVHVSKFCHDASGGHRGGIIIAGLMQQVLVCSMSGDVTSQINSSSPCIYTVNVCNKPSTIMTFGGMSTKIDVCFNLNYKDHTVSTIES